VEPRSRPEPSIGRRTPTPEAALLKGCRRARFDPIAGFSSGWRDITSTAAIAAPSGAGQGPGPSAANVSAPKSNVNDSEVQVRRQLREDEGTRLLFRSLGSTSPRFSRHSWISADSSALMTIRASEPPMKCRRAGFVARGAPIRSLRVIIIGVLVCLRRLRAVTSAHGAMARLVDKVPYNMYGCSLRRKTIFCAGADCDTPTH
jgi:hypothetical protein